MHPPRRNLGIGIALIALIASLLLVLWPHRGDLDLSAMPLTLEPPSSFPVFQPADDEPAPPETTDTPDGFEPTTAHEEALAAAIEYSGEGVVRCLLPEGTGPLDLRRLNWAGRSGDVLTLATTEPFGQVKLMPGDTPPRPRLPDPEDVERWMEDPKATGLDLVQMTREAQQEWDEEWAQPEAVVTWSHAHPGTLGDCDVNPSTSVLTVPVQVVDSDGEPIERATVGTSVNVNGLSMTDAEGWTETSVWADHPTEVFAMKVLEQVTEGPRPLISTSTQVSPTERATEIVLVVPPFDMDRMKQEMQVEYDTRRAAIESLKLALEEPDLSSQAQAQLRNWLDQVE